MMNINKSTRQRGRIISYGLGGRRGLEEHLGVGGGVVRDFGSVHLEAYWRCYDA